jgi:hypothetical protein
MGSRPLRACGRLILRVVDSVRTLMPLQRTSKPQPLAASPIRRLSVVAVVLAMSAMVGQVRAARGQDQGKDELSVQTSSGGIEVSDSVKAKEIGLPVYPGATQVSDRDKSEGNLLFSLTRTGKPDVKFVVAKFETSDDVAQVRDFYRKKLGHKVTKFVVDASDGSLAFEIRADNRHAKFVQLKASGGKTEIDMVRLEGVDISDTSIK